MICALFCFIFYSVDATESDGAGRMVNDAAHPNANCKAMTFSGCVDGRTRICLFAITDIDAGAELRFDYGVPDLPWRRKVQILMLY